MLQVAAPQPGQIIGRMMAVDLDEGDNGMVDYELANESELQNFFGVDRTSSELFVQKAPRNDSSYAMFHLLLRACDRGRPQLCSTEDFYVEFNPDS
ncbi:hypothetical protein BOX15_Mlig005777g2 [Macrostomum lignano]|uniref:Cadherin domain-containing protein n=2 Tax=Macrostomum lignano TaxID=282301 RepID=A0A267DKF3_9PLAT|nr:hypothetical protein BOX15_Mlig005777g2 [Macrostomum lignano]